ncbi:hypothetical protein RclHR1_04450003 [Rhizophagus clarus]|uniref:Uncharacterized protein n=1 Tax=Rhizophagus clarus TaxID=94130 RepID=A0A2Z6RUY1_9GLOM|nr:hypothetical protein RclHR1_04450003 [Rhizophagus clarus]
MSQLFIVTLAKERFLNLSDCNLEDIVEFENLAGRPHFVARLVLEIIHLEMERKDLSKQDVLESAVKKTIQVINRQLEFEFNDIIKNEKPYDNVDRHGWEDVMETLFVDCWFFGGYIPNHEINDRERHLVEAGIAHLLENNKKSLAIDEPLSVNVVKKILLPMYKSPDKAILEKLAGLMKYNGKTVADFVHTIYDDNIFEIGGIKKTNLPEWTNKANIKIESYGNLEQLSWKLRNKFKNDVEFIEMLLQNPANRMYVLDPNIVMRPDGVYIGNNIDHIDDYWTLLINAKIYKDPLSEKYVNIDKRTTEWKYVYYEDKEGENTHKIKKHIIKGKLDTIRNKYMHQGSIRIHFILPHLAESKDKSDQGGCRVEGNDIIMYIDQNLLNKYFQNSQYVNVISNIL